MRSRSFGETKKSALDNIIEHVRVSRVLPYIKRGATILDLGCGYNGSLLNKVSGIISKGIGVDLSVNDKAFLADSNIKLIQAKVDKRIPIANNSIDLVTALAIIEHVNDPEKMLSEIYRVLKPGGRFVITTPSTYGKIPLELMASLGVISKAEIEDHKRYYSKLTLNKTIAKFGFKTFKVQYFGIMYLNLIALGNK